MEIGAIAGAAQLTENESVSLSEHERIKKSLGHEKIKCQWRFLARATMEIFFYLRRIRRWSLIDSVWGGGLRIYLKNGTQSVAAGGDRVQRKVSFPATGTEVGGAQLRKVSSSLPPVGFLPGRQPSRDTNPHVRLCAFPLTWRSGRLVGERRFG